MHEDREVEDLAAYYLDATAAATAVQRGVDLGAWAFVCAPPLLLLSRFISLPYACSFIVIYKMLC